MMTLTWTEAFRQLWTHAARHRGMHVDGPGPMRDDMTQGYPRTRGSDVLAITAVVNPVMHELGDEPSNLAITRRWHYCANDVAEFAAEQPAREYVHNRAFWPALAATLAHLAAIDAPVPHEWWRVLLSVIGHSDEAPKLDDDLCLHLAADTYEALWTLQQTRLAELRGADVRELSPGLSGVRMTVPRTTNADILQLRIFWSMALLRAVALLNMKDEPCSPETMATLGLDGLRRRWRTLQAEVDAHAGSGDPGDVYSKNHEFWRATASLAVTLAAFDDQPLTFHLRVRRAASMHRNARTYEFDERTFVKSWTAQRDQMAKARGSDLREPSAGDTGGPMTIPRTTNADIVQLAAYWRAVAVDQPGHPTNVLERIGHPSALDENKQWRAAIADVDQIAKAGKPGDLYPRNHAFWRASQSLATALDGLGRKPLPGRITLDDLPEESLPDRLLDAAKHLPEQIADATSAVVHAVGDLGRQAGAGFFDGLGVPLLIGAGGLAALWLLLRRRNCSEEE